MPDRVKGRRGDSDWSPESTSPEIESLRDELKLHRLGLSFLSPDVESAYRGWQQHIAVPLVRIAMIAAMVAWAVVSIYTYLLGSTQQRLAALLLIAFLMYPALVVVVATTYVARFRRWMLPSAAFANALAGLLVVSIGFFVFNVPEVASANIVSAAFIGFTLLGLRVSLAAPAVLSYVATFYALLLNAMWRGELSGRMAAFYSLAPALAYVVGLLVCAVLDGVTHQRYRQEQLIAAQSAALDRERRRADGLLYSIFPQHIAERLKSQPGVIADEFEEATIIFADLVGFTELVATQAPQATVTLLNQVFGTFDAITAQHGVEKIKTVGDEYMAAVGVPERCSNQADTAVEFALDLRDALGELSAQVGTPLELRIGIHTGTVVAGVIGDQKLAYDLWGDTVNTASRMESNGLQGEIQISEATRDRLTGSYELRERGLIDVKGKGPMRVWLVDRTLPS